MLFLFIEGELGLVDWETVSMQMAFPGEVLCKADPYVHVLMHKESGKRCDECFCSQTQLLKCSSCRASWYCSKSCQKLAWKFHRQECIGYKKISPYIPKDSTRLLLRLLIRSKWCDDCGRCVEAFGQRRTLDDLMSHKNEIKQDKTRFEEFLQLSLSLKAFAGDDFLLPECDELLDFYGKICTNAFTICDAEMNAIGVGLYLGASVLDHSCRPNAEVVFDGIRLIVRCTEVMSRGQQVTISYIDLLDTTSDRRQALQTAYYFQCKCSLCLDDDVDRMKQGLLCTHTGCPGIIVRTDDGNFLPCQSCGRLEPDEVHSRRLADAVALSRDVLQQVKDLKQLEKYKEQLLILEPCLSSLKTTFHPLNIYYTKLLDAAFDACIQVTEFVKALKYGLKLLEPYRCHLPKHHWTVGLHLMKLGKIQMYLEKLLEASNSLQQAEAIISVTHGLEHPLYKELRQLMEQCQMEMTCLQRSLED